MADTSPDDTLLLVGKFGRCHGLSGLISVISYTEPHENILDYLPWNIKQAHQSQWVDTLSDHQHHPNKLLVKLPHYEDRTQAETLVNATIWIKKTQLPTLGQDEVYWHQLLGLNVINHNQITLGTVDYLFDTGANDVLVLKDCGSKRERLIPYTDDVVINIDLDRKLITVNWHEDD